MALTMSAKDLSISKTEALQGLLRSLGHAHNDSSSSGATLSTEQLRKLSEKIDGILGDDKSHGLEPGDQPSQLVNEDGLPIVDISEPFDEDLQTGALSSSASELDLTPLSLLPPAERERRRRERDRILDLLEEEERLQQLQEERDAEEERREEIRKRRESELHRLREARELQKRMGQALVRHAKGAQESGEDDARSKSRTAPSTSKKNVSFADVPIVVANKSDQQTPTPPQPNLGDVTLGRLRAQSRVPLVSTTEAQKYPMKMHVVERQPVTTSTSSPYSDADSDDESTSSAARLSPPLERDFLGEEDKSSNDAVSDDDAPLEEGFDYDMAQHHREIALEYHRKRHAIGAETAKAMATPIPDGHDQHEIGQTPLSRFRADRMTAAYDKSHSTSIGQNVIPASRQKSLQTSVRLAKLENGQLIGGESGESGSEDETAREVIEMLRTGNIQNIGPDFNPPAVSSIASPKDPDTPQSQPTGTSIVAGPSKFELGRGEEIVKTTTVEDSNDRNDVRSRPAISNVVERKAPRPSPRQHFPVNKAPSRSRIKISEPIDSPSFPMKPTSSSSLAVTPPSVEADLSVTPDPIVLPHTPPQSSSSVKRPLSKFMAERKKLVE